MRRESAFSGPDRTISYVKTYLVRMYIVYTDNLVKHSHEGCFAALAVMRSAGPPFLHSLIFADTKLIASYLDMRHSTSR
ncbi:hypothetical protein JYU34_004397 [Plutella xylostella]|uniref:Uncharacterized protein n=1 Tax=Plutella xylostella TaxID=51655 RepID=A0ABQ7QXW6_PLUXY|nr:hypothetical protein JYU34_004397 [Plutella xylostella]